MKILKAVGLPAHGVTQPCGFEGDQDVYARALLRAETGEIVAVRAADEPVVTASVPSGLALARLCYHLGNRHVQLAIGQDDEGGWVRFPPDHVLEALAARLGAAR